MDKNEALKLLIKEYPFLTNKHTRLVKQFAAADGRISNCFLAESNKEGFGRFIAKSFVHNPDSLMQEWVFLGLLEQKEAHAPRLLVKEHKPEHFLLMEYIDGIPASQALVQGHDPADIFRKIGEATGMTHGIELDTFGSILEPSDISWKENVLERLGEKLQVVQPLVDKRLFKAVSDTVEATKHILDDESRGKPVLIHHDIYLENFLVKKADNQIVLIDYGIAYGGRPLFDLAKFYIWDLTRYPEQKDNFLRAYSNYVTLPPNFNEVMKFYLLYECFGMIAYFHKIGATKDRDDAIGVLEDIVYGEGVISELIR